MNYFLCPRDISGLSHDENTEVYILEGKSSVTKSKLLSAITVASEENGYSFDKYLSKYDYDKLSAVHIKGLNTIIADNTYCNKNIGNYYKIKKVINTDNFYSVENNFEEETFEILNRSIKASLSKSAKFENAAKNVCIENRKIIMPYINKAKILNYIFRFLGRNNISESAQKGKNISRHITETTPWGIHTCYETVMQNCKTIAVIRDEYRYFSSTLILGLAEALNQCSYNTITLYCSLAENCPEHLIIPELSLAFFTENRNHPYPFNDTGIMTTKRFMKNDITPAHTAELKWNNDIIDDYLDESVFALFEAMEADNAISDMLEDYFIEEEYNAQKESLCNEIFNS